VPVSVALFTRDLRVHDNPVLTAAAAAARGRVVPLFVLDDAILASGYNRPNRARFLAESLADLDAALRGIGARGLVVRRGDPATEAAAVCAATGSRQVHVAADVSGFARRRHRRLCDRLSAERVEVVAHDEVVTVVAPGALRTAAGEAFAVFSPYHRRWQQQPVRDLVGPPRLRPVDVAGRGLPGRDDICAGATSPDAPVGGETRARQLVARWIAGPVHDYGGGGHDDLATDGTSRLSPYLHFGCLSPVEVVRRAGSSPGAAAFVRQLAWRDFYAQLLAARPDVVRTDYKPRGDRWRDDQPAVRAWKDGRTGYPVVDAGMRQLRQEGWMHNRARLIVGSFLTKTLYVDWRVGAQHFVDWLVDGDTASNTMNWQWIAGRGTDTRPSRVLNPLLQAARYDPTGAYVRRFVPELRCIEGPDVHAPWTLPADVRRTLDYPAPIVDLAEGRRRFLAARRGPPELRRS
jgi:deoxyribodipyrimidine photo-lyase